jgi:hypothetical protein
MLTLEDLAASQLQRIQWHVSGSIWSMRMTMCDGRESPVMGGRNACEDQYMFKGDDNVEIIRLLESQDHKYVNAL